MVRKYKKIALLLVLLMQLLMLINCSGLTIEQKIFWKYYLVANEVEGSSVLSYKLNTGSYVGITPDGVIEIAESDEFIVTKNLINSKIKYYAFPKIETDEFTFEKHLIGPMNKNELNVFEKQNNLSLKFEGVNNLHD